MSKAKLTAAEWELVKDAPYWVEAALAAADKRAAPVVGKKEAKALEEVRQSYKSNNALVRDIMADQSERAAAIDKASKADADVALGRIAAIVEAKLGGDDLDALNDFLLKVGERIAGAAKENVLGLGSEVSKQEAAALKELAVVLRATDAQKKARKDQAQAAQAAQAAAAMQHAREEAEAKAKAEAARKEAEAKAQAEAARKEAEAKAKKDAEAKERLEKARAEAEERQREAAAKEQLEKAREEAEERQKEALAKREAAKAEEERAAAEAAAKAKEEQARAEAAAPRFKEFIAEHTVVAGENLSLISQKYYGTQANFRLIYEANKDVIGDNMNLIRPGQKLRIPKL